MSDGSNTGLLDPEVDSPETDVDQNYIDNGIDAAEKFANRGGDTPITDSQPTDSSAQGDSTTQGGSGKKSWADRARSLGSKIKNRNQSSGSSSPGSSGPSTQQRAANGAAEAADTGMAAAQAVETGGASLGKRYGMDAAKGVKKAAETGNIQAGLNEGTKKIRQDLKIVLLVVFIAVSLLIILVALVVIPIVMLFGSDNLSAIGGATSTLSVVMDGPGTGSASQPLAYTIHVKSTAPTTNIVITDPVPENTYFDPKDNPNICVPNPDPCPAQDNQGIYSPVDKTVTWTITGSSSASDTAPFETAFVVTFRINIGVSNIKIFNLAYAESEETTTTTTTTDPNNTNLQVGP